MSDEAAVTFDEARSRFELAVDGHTAFIDTTRSGDTLTLVHTEVPEELEGRGVGSKLVAGALEFIRANRLGVVPQCPFVRSYLQRHPDVAMGVGIDPSTL